MDTLQHLQTPTGRFDDDRITLGRDDVNHGASLVERTQLWLLLTSSQREGHEVLQLHPTQAQKRVRSECSDPILIRVLSFIKTKRQFEKFLNKAGK